MPDPTMRSPNTPEHDAMCARLEALMRPVDPGVAEIRALRAEISELRAALEPRVSAILTGTEVDRAYRQLQISQ